MPDAGSRDSRAIGGDEAHANRLLAVVREVVAEVRPDFIAAVGLDATLDHDLGLDSLTRVELLLRVERSFSVQLPASARTAAINLRGGVC